LIIRFLNPANCPPLRLSTVGVTKEGEVARTLLPVPVLATETRFLEASVATAEEAVSPVSCIDVALTVPPDTLVAVVADVAVVALSAVRACPTLRLDVGVSTVTPPCTSGTNSVPLSGSVATGNSDILGI
jgi:hypothetical protein